MNIFMYTFMCIIEKYFRYIMRINMYYKGICECEQFRI